MIELAHVSKSFPQRYGIVAALRGTARERRPAIVDASFTVARGELFGLLGANGSGKSTLLRMLTGLIAPDAGRIVAGGIDVATHPVAARRRVALSTGDERSFYGRLSARRNLELYAGLIGLSGAARDAAIAAAVAAVDLRGDLDRRFDAFSSGMRQRLSVARALLADPDVLLLDEPTRALDPVHAEELRTVIRDQLVRRSGKTVVLATNLLDEAWQLCDRVAILRAGRVLAVGNARELRERAAGTRRYVVGLDRIDAPLLARVNAAPGVLGCDVTTAGSETELRVTLDTGGRSLTELLRAVSANGVAVTAIRDEGLRASELFARLTEAADA